MGKKNKTLPEAGAKLNSLLSDEVKKIKKKEKSRGAEIMKVFANHNFYLNGLSPEELRITLEDLGPTYVKIGQIMSSRSDMLPESYCKELEKLRQNVKPLEAQVARAVIEQETGKKIDELFSEFRDEPLGSASVGQAHYGVLKDGTKVVTKVQRPFIADQMRRDFVLLKKLASSLKNAKSEDEDSTDTVDLLAVIEELEAVTNEELDFRVEAENTRFFKQNCIVDTDVINCPDVIDALTTERLFTMTFVEGYSIAKRDKLIEDGCDPNQLGSVILDNYVHQVLDVGVFHGDPHQGNIMVSGGKPYWIDFGMVGRISESDIGVIQALILSLINMDLEALVNAVTSMGATSPKTNRTNLMDDLNAMMDKYMTVATLEDIDMSVLFGEITDICNRNYISIPGRYTMLIRSIATMEGVIEELAPELKLFDLITQKLLERTKKSFNLEQELKNIGRGALDIGRKAAKIPSLASDALNSLIKGKAKINLELTGYDNLVKDIQKLAKNLTLAFFAAVIFFGSCLICMTDVRPKTPSGVPVVAVVGFVFSIALGIFSIKRMTKK